mgnify:CR=1 FL=1
MFAPETKLADGMGFERDSVGEAGGLAHGVRGLALAEIGGLRCRSFGRACAVGLSDFLCGVWVGEGGNDRALFPF